jgi:hypothetical protein
MYVNQELAGSYLKHIFLGGKASLNHTKVDESKQLGAKHENFLHNLTGFALVSVKATEVQGTEAQMQKRWHRQLLTTSSLFRRRDPPH